MKKYLIFIFLILYLAGCSHRASSAEPVSQTTFVFDTVATITLLSYPKNVSANELINDCFKLCSEYEGLFSKTIPESDVSRINSSTGEPVKVSQETADIIASAINYSEITDGAFDISIAPVSSLWDFKAEKPASPAPEAISSALTHVNYKNIDLNGTTVTLLDSSASIDLGGIAKGYIADRVYEFLISNNVTGAIIDLGGNILTIGPLDKEKTYSIGLQKPFSDSGDVIASVSVNAASVVTSGVYERFFYENNNLYHHILDPKTGFPVQNDLYSVAIISEKSIDGDALSTACFVLGTDDALSLIESLDGIEAIFIKNDYSFVTSSGIGEKIPVKFYK